MLGGRRCLIFAQGCWRELGDWESGVLGLKDLATLDNAPIDYGWTVGKSTVGPPPTRPTSPQILKACKTSMNSTRVLLVPRHCEVALILISTSLHPSFC